MNLQELKSALPKDWLEVRAHIIEADELDVDVLNVDTLNVQSSITTGIAENPMWASYDPQITNSSNLSAITNGTTARVTRLGSFVTISGSFTATVAASVATVAFTLQPPAGSTSVLGNHRAAFASCNNDTASFVAMSLIDLQNSSPPTLVMTLRTATGGNQPGAPTANCVFHWQAIFESAI